MENIDLNSIPVYYQPHENDKYLSLESYCPSFNEEMEKMFSSQDFLEISFKYQATLTALSPHMGPIYLPSEIEPVIDTLFVLKQHNQKLSIWQNVFYYEISEYSNMISFYPWTNHEIIRLRAGPILGKIVDDMKKKISGEIHSLKLQAYNTQSHLLMVVMNALGVFNNLLPPYCATLIFELHDTPNSTHSVRLLYLNSSVPEDGYQVPHLLTIEGCSEFCPLDFFDNYTKQYVPQDWETECGITNYSTFYLWGLFLGFALVLFITCVIFCVTCVFYKKIHTKAEQKS